MTRSAQNGADEQAHAAMAQARTLLRAAADLEKRADDKREAATKAHMAAVIDANKLDQQAEEKKAEARKKLAGAGSFAKKEQQADLYRAAARPLFIKAQRLEHQAKTLDAQGDAERKRVKTQRDAAAQLLAGKPDDAMKADAADLNKQAEQDEKDAVKLQEAESQARKQAEHLRQDAAALIAKANQLDPDGN
jgi:hypothetical protein